MGKSFLVIDTPHKTCLECRLHYQYADGPYIQSVCAGTGEMISDVKRPDRCPLRAIPAKKDLEELEKYSHGEDYIWSEGWNACIDEILRECDCKKNGNKRL